MSATLKIGEGLALPLEAVTEKLGFIGRTGQGKTYAAMKLAEEMDRVGAQFITLDPVGKWWALRLAADGKSPALTIPVLGGLKGDLPLEPTAGKLIADLVADRGISVVLDVSQFESDNAKNRFASDFAARFFFRKKAEPSAVHLFLEEAQEFIPQNPMGDGDKMMLHNFTRMWKLGRNFGIGGSLITQRPQEVSKKVLNLTELLFAFQLTGSHERDAVEKWIEDKAIDEDIAAELPKLQNGRPHVWSPGWLQISRVVRINSRKTFDSSSTPKVGAKAEKAATLAPVDLAKLKDAMAATIEKAEAEDPKRLRQRVAELTRALEKRDNNLVHQLHTAPAPKPEIKKVEIPTWKEADIKRAERLVERLEQLGAQIESTGAGLASGLRQSIEGSLIAHKTIAGAGAAPAQRPATFGGRGIPQARLVRTVHKPEGNGKGSDDGQLSGPERRIVDAIAWLDYMAVPSPEKRQVALVAGYKLAGAFLNPLARLRARGIVSYQGKGVVLTSEGKELANTPEQMTPADLREKTLERLDGPERKILEALYGLYPADVEKERLAELTGYAMAGAFLNPLGRLRSMGLVDYPEPRRVRAAWILFQEG